MGTQRYTLNSGQRGNLRDSLQPAATDSGKLSSPKGPQTPTALKEAARPESVVLRAESREERD